MYQSDTVSSLVWGIACKSSAQISTSYWVMFDAHSPFYWFISSKVGKWINLCPVDPILIVLASAWNPNQTWLVSFSWEVYSPFVFRRWSIELSSELLAKKAM